MKIEEKYGFNRTSKKTFVTDQILGFVFGLIVNMLLVLGIYYTAMLGTLMPVILSIVLCIFVLIMNFLFPLISRAQNKFVPLEEGSLRDKLTELLTNHGYTVKEIEVMDASKRTTKSNAYFTGFGKQKKIVLFDNLVNTMTEDEICAVFAHELGHGLNHDVPKLFGLNCINMILMAFVSYFTVSFDKIYTDFGFSGVNYGFTYVVMTAAFLPLIMQITSLLINAVSRRAEYRADAQAYKEGYADAMIAGLKKLSRENFSHLSPSALIVTLEYSHPPLSERIAAIEKLKTKN
jgi:STE24 endopeptidase